MCKSNASSDFVVNGNVNALAYLQRNSQSIRNRTLDFARIFTAVHFDFDDLPVDKRLWLSALGHFMLNGSAPDSTPSIVTATASLFCPWRGQPQGKRIR